ncbi:MAG TPA: hypothetical protein VL625_00810 [Patescibacteria group bacterium]|nr:hypothetical protein [Patescibacteria group bacterium]
MDILYLSYTIANLYLSKNLALQEDEVSQSFLQYRNILAPSVKRRLTEILAVFLPMFAVIVVWVPFEISAALNEDEAWLLICAQRLLDGGRSLTDFYQPNPPMSTLMYVPDVLLARLTHSPIYYIPHLLGLAAMSLSAWGMLSLLKRFPELDDDARAVAFGAYLIASTIGASFMFFAERDEYVAWGLIPFLLAQILITRAAAVEKRILWSVLIGGGICILIKPHYLLLPAVAVVHRMVARRRVFSVMRDPDVIALLCVSSVYAILIAVYFWDDVTKIFPDLVKLYLPVQNPFETAKQGFAGLILLLLLRLCLRPVNEGVRRIVNYCTIGAMLSGLLFVIQLKGLYYHEIPFFLFYSCGVGLALHDRLGRGLRSSKIAAFITMTLVLDFSLIHAPAFLGYPTHEDYKKLPLTQLAANLGPNETFFVVTEGMDVIHQAAIYSGHIHASRFPDLWFLTGTQFGWRHDGDDVRYANYVAEDLARYKPSVMAIISGDRYVDVISWLSARSPAFRNEMKRYVTAGNFVDNRRNYFKGTILDFDHVMTYDLYRRSQ